MPETHLLQPVLASLPDDALVCQECVIPLYGRNVPIDIAVELKGGRLIGYEGKVSGDARLVEQVTRWHRHFQETWAVCRQPRKEPGPVHAQMVETLELMGCGLLYVTESGHLRKAMGAKPRPLPYVSLADDARQAMRDHVPGGQKAGSPGGKKPSDDFGDARALLKETAPYGPMTAKELARELNWPIRKRNMLVKLARRNELDGIQSAERAGRREFWV